MKVRSYLDIARLESTFNFYLNIYLYLILFKFLFIVIEFDDVSRNLELLFDRRS